MSAKKRFTQISFTSLMLSLMLFNTSCQEFLEEIKDELKGNKDQELPETVVINQQALYPEGVEFDPLSGQFLVSSLTQGTIGKVDDEGQYTPFIEDDDFVATIGIQVDISLKRLLVCISDPNAGNLAALGIYDLNNADRLEYVNLGESLAPGEPHFANDVAVDDEGNAYVTDSFSPYIYKVARNGDAEIFLSDDTFATPAGAFGLNGIIYHPDGYLIAGFSATNSLYKIPLDDPYDFSQIHLDAALTGPDGLYLSRNAKTLIVVNNAGGVAPGKVLAFESEDDWESAALEEEFVTGQVFPTTAVQRENEFYVLYAYLNELFSGNTSLDEYQIKQVDFDD
ncbi:hypothetical protein [Catalinimonas niigatensis]|uniref:hypothetical protein n=1 Tax=Catalinimonas niigatensis TaxID=1397264 RepID=UPI002666E99E|nr:hypothetical protein [Catalinimonas niigatensis]WPP51607.1 hypothetical protein PZB72_04305 [Catalinimonas niigatensis]